jgi:phospholipid-binding lipoprotein MlaA
MSARTVSLVAFLAAPLLAGCVTTPGGVSEAELDRFEKTNRAIYSFNKGVDTAVLKPVTQGYRAVVPGIARRGVSNALDNVDEPLSFINAVLQGKFKVAFRAADRFLINSTFGLAGLFDHATEMGLTKQEEDFGQTLAAWGVGSGPYIMLPLLGPSTLRDTVGFGVDSVTDPWPKFQKDVASLSGTERLGVTAGEAIDLRSRLVDTADPLLATALDEYATVRAAYLQQRLHDIYDGDPPEDNFTPTFDDETPPAAAPSEDAAASESATDEAPATESDTDEPKAETVTP